MHGLRDCSLALRLLSDVRAVSGEFFDVLGVIGHALWRELFGAEPDLSKLSAQMPSAG